MRTLGVAALVGVLLGTATLGVAPTAAPKAAVGPLVSTPLTVATGASAGNASGKSLTIPQGWTAEVWANVPGARMAAWSPDGKLLVTTGANRRIEILTPTTAGHAPTVKTLLTGTYGVQGITFTKNGSVLVLGQDTRIFTYSYNNGVLTNPKIIVNNLPTGGHSAKGVAASGDVVYYSVGSSGNRTPEDRTANPQRATIWRVRLDGTQKTMITRGVRNGFGLAVGPGGWLFTAVNQMDNQPYPFKDSTGQYGNLVQSYINENPVDQVTRVSIGRDLGWPYCVPDTRNNPKLLAVPFVNDPKLNPTGSKLNCKGLYKTMLGLPGHSAPLGLNFTTGTALESVLGNGAIITTHGSWNRTPPRAPLVRFSPWNSATQTLGASVSLVGGFQNSDGSRWGRCVDAVVGPDGSLYVTDDLAGLVYRITPPS